MWMLCAALLALGSVQCFSSDSKAVTTTLTTKWPSTPLLLEASEFLAEESQDKFWDFVEANQNIESDHDDTDLAYYDLILKRASVLLSPVQLNLLKLALSLRAYSSTVHSFQQIASNEPPPPGCKAFFNIHGQTSCDTERLKVMLDNQTHLSFLHFSTAGADVNATVIGENDPVDEVQGFLFGKLKTIYPELKEQLKELRKHLIESTNDMAPLKVWQMQGTLGLQPGDSALFINGLHIDLDVQDIFSVFDVLRDEARVMEGLRSLLIDTPYIHDILKLNVQPSDSDYAVDIRNPAVNWINNLETDGRYASWPSNVQELLRPTFPGVIRQIRKNFHNLVMILDPTHENTAELISVAEMFYSNNIPLRIGVVFVVNDSDEVDGMQDAGVALLRAFNYISDDVDSQMAFDMLNRVPSGGKLKVEHVVGVLEKRYPYVEISSILGPDSAYDNNRKEGKAYYEQTGVGPLPVVLYNGMPLQREQLDPDELETVVMHKILETTSFFQRTVYLGELNSDHDVVDFIMNQPNVVPRINSRVLSTNRNYLDLSATNNHFIDEYARFLFLDTKDKNAAVANSLNYMTKKGEVIAAATYDGIIRPVTFWVVGDFDQPSGRQLMYDAIRHMKTRNNVRLGVINNPTENADCDGLFALGYFTIAGGMDVPLFKSAYESPNVNFLLAHSAYCRDVLKLQKGQRAVISNGRIIGPLEEGEVFNQDDFLLLESIILKTSGESIRAKIQQLGMVEDRASDLVMKVDALLSSQPKGEARLEHTFAEDRYSALKIRPKEEEVYFDVVAVVDPVTRDAQKLAPLLLVLKQLVNVNLRVFMNCQSKLSDLPLKSFYRYVLEPEVSFMADSSFAPGPMAKFLDMPQSLLFTLNLNTPESWMVESVHTRYDLDNIYLEEWLPECCNCMCSTLVLRDFMHRFCCPKSCLQVQKKPDMMKEELLSDDTHENDSGFWTSITRGLTGGSKPEEPKQEKDDVINIFSVASGHLYERFLRIMMLSVLKHTKTPVKFWFLKNYLSPTFKEFIPYMAEKYGFQYELVQYKWPRWLHQQTEKQRIIWGYKILFLDVLFPLAVDKILFVDADQIVRTDLKELRDFDLEGAPYGYTPFCESRREMDGYRFWKSGYWASHLAGRKYHISALYVVDLKKFRKIAAGDRLRGQYQGLSQDPNSLSNLDQDLPNNMIHQVPIKSLPQEWLWCETWCDDASKKKAKTIDLCNNPQTKEPKLQAAVRIVAEWSDYDQEIKRIYNNFLEEKERDTTDSYQQTDRKHPGETNLSFSFLC
uniref:UDP-glucose ceramide glucosyltransferase-like 1 n=1 Tax=Sinocyclocheilus grahami TaxID=75366 RepID=A0A672NQ95_SINGR